MIDIMNQLNDWEKSVLGLHYQHNRSVSTISVISGVSRVTIESIIVEYGSRYQEWLKQQIINDEAKHALKQWGKDRNKKQK